MQTQRQGFPPHAMAMFTGVDASSHVSLLCETGQHMSQIRSRSGVAITVMTRLAVLGLVR